MGYFGLDDYRLRLTGSALIARDADEHSEAMMKEMELVGRAFNQLERDNRRTNTIVAGELAVAVAHAVAIKTPSQMSARDAAATLQTCGGFPIAWASDRNEHKRTRSHVKPNSTQRRAERIKEGKLKILDGALVGA